MRARNPGKDRRGENGNLIEQARAANANLEIVARAHSDTEVEHLKKYGATLIIMGEREIARGMTEHILSRVDQAKAARGEGGEIVREQAPGESPKKRVSLR